LENVTDEITAPRLTEQEMKKRRPSGKHPYKPQLATKVKWSLEDTMKELVEADVRMKNVLAWLEETNKFDIDERGKAHLYKLALELYALGLHVSKAKEIMANTIAESKVAK
jgi:hypothetical protein